VTWVAFVLIGAGVGDLVRAADSRRGRLAAHVVSPIVILAMAGLTGVFGLVDVLVLSLASVGVAAWIELSAYTHRTARGALVALGTLGVTLVAVLALSGWASDSDGAFSRWLDWADLPGLETADASRVLLLLGLALFNIATGNVIVRLVLLAIGALRPDQLLAGSGSGAVQAAQPSDRLKGGRLLGPMERLVILGLGLAGELGAAGIVIAAKGLLRFPEIQAAGRQTSPTGTGIDDVTEYFLVGSFVSWLVALVSLGVAVL
jgi:hypothetical protein